MLLYYFLHTFCMILSTVYGVNLWRFNSRFRTGSYDKLDRLLGDNMKWTAWQECSKECGTGIQIRTRQCLPFEVCAGMKSEERECEGTSCAHADEKPLEPTGSDWTTWSECSATCGNGTETRDRPCSESDDCMETKRESRPCDIPPCTAAVNEKDQDHQDQVAKWSEWSSCSASCGQGIRVRDRQCSEFDDCIGGNQEVQPCQGVLCTTAIDEEEYMQVPQWTQWSTCSSSCGEGIQTRTRYCSLVESCSGNKQEVKKCLEAPCLDSGSITQSQWQTWYPWSSCSVSCGEGFRRRSRLCPNYVGCGKEPRTQTEKCHVLCSDWVLWSNWQACSAPCGGGDQIRNRDCPVNEACQGDQIDLRPCNPQDCCSVWSEWSYCSVTCKGGRDGIRSRERHCTERNAAVLGGYETKEHVSKEPCDANLQPCEFWMEWQAWSSCSQSCGLGQRSRVRACSIVGHCVGDAEENDQCMQPACPQWLIWSSWTVCSATCGGGQKLRQRECTENGACEGDVSEGQSCGTFPCPKWSQWGPWSYCSEPCGGGVQKRGRVCDQYILCSGEASDKRFCNVFKCAKIGEWEPWGICTATCGGGFHIRERPCITDPEFCDPNQSSSPQCMCKAHKQEGKPCNTRQCPHFDVWQNWESCTAKCGGGQRIRRRPCIVDTEICNEFNQNNPSCFCNGLDIQTDICGYQPCAHWSPWQSWGECDAPCGGGARERKRKCEINEDFCAGEKLNHPACFCSGLNHSNEQCNAHRCPIWAEWETWSSCSSVCEGGVKTRQRMCKNDEQFCLSSPEHESCQCGEANFDQTECNTHRCPRWKEWSGWRLCSTSCNGGVQSRNRVCDLDYTRCYGSALFNDPSCQCIGDSEKFQPCNEHMCPSWTEWQSWELCSSSCGGGMQSRVRTCSSDPIACAEDEISAAVCDCKGSNRNEQQCNAFECPHLDSWVQWSACSVSCGSGQRTRNRNCQLDFAYCGNNDPFSPGCQCDGPVSDMEICDAGPCFNWGVWNEWSRCSRVCGGGSRNRARECPQSGSCPGLNQESGFCNQVTCPEWGDWSFWSDCSTSCGSGQRARTRSCPLERGCSPGDPLEMEFCNTNTCPQWTQWSAWSQCGKTCGASERVRTRDCNPIAEGCLGKAEDVEECFVTACTVNTFWSEWSPCTTTCGGGIKHRSRVTCPVCPPEDDVAPCSDNVCPTWSVWAPWSSCSVSCGGGQRIRDRSCQDVSGFEIPRGCVGRKQEVDALACNAFAC